MGRYSAVNRQNPQSNCGVAVVLVNLGTPDAPTTPAVRRYLAEFLSDPRVVEVPRFLWKIILHGVILRIRPARSARAYREIWTDEGSPLLVLSERLRAALSIALNKSKNAELWGKTKVVLAMRYGKPSMSSVLRHLREEGFEQFIFLPLYPQYSGSTTGSVWDALAKELMTWRVVPNVQFIRDYWHQEHHIQALADSVRGHWQTHGRADRLLMSFHGIPKRYADTGDVYRSQCESTSDQLAKMLGLKKSEWLLSYQSRVGREQWLLPYTDETLKQWPKQGVRSVQVICPGFAVDCLETLEEIAVENRETFEHAGGERYEYIACLNDSANQVRAFESLLAPHLQAMATSISCKEALK